MIHVLKRMNVSTRRRRKHLKTEVALFVVERPSDLLAVLSELNLNRFRLFQPLGLMQAA